ncbi:MAG: hypothetical protein ACI3VN_01160 [Candidatus Onthomonas sp.]
MPASRPPDYIDQVLGYVQFPFDRPAIRQELEDHIEDLLSDVPELPEEERPGYIRGRMGDPETVGKALNQEHSPVLGWLWKLSGWIMWAVLLWNLPALLGLPSTVLDYVTYGPGHYDPPASGLVATVDCEVTGQIDDMEITIDQLRLYDNNELEICYRTFQSPFCSSACWSFSLAPDYFRNENGAAFDSGGGFSKGGSVSYHQECIDHFDPDSKVLILDYDHNGRIFYAEIPLDWEVAS